MAASCWRFEPRFLEAVGGPFGPLLERSSGREPSSLSAVGSTSSASFADSSVGAGAALDRPLGPALAKSTGIEKQA